MWKRDMREGKGTMTWSDGSVFEGEWRLDMRHHGSMRMIDSSVYEGPFENDRYHGRGKIMIKQSSKGPKGIPVFKVFEGIFINGKTPSEGKIYYTDGSHGLYFGEHFEFEKQGYGYFFSSPRPSL